MYLRVIIALFVICSALLAQPAFISVVNFKGVDPTGATDSTLGIAAAINKAINTGNELYFPAGVYLCNNAKNGVVLNVLANENTAIVRSLGWPPASVGGRIHGGLTIRGAGPGKTIIKTTLPSADLMAAISSGATIYYPQYLFEDFTLQGPDTTKDGDAGCPFSGTNGISGNGLRISGTNSSKVTIRNVNSEYFCGAGKAAVWLDSAEEFRLIDVSLRYSDIGLKLTTDTNAGIGVGVKLDSNFSYGGYIERNSASTFSNLEVQGNCKNGLFLRLAGSMTLTSPYFEHNGYCAGGPWHALTFNRVTDSYITGLLSSTAKDDIFFDGSTFPNSARTPPVNSRNHISIGGPSGFQAGAKITLDGSYSAGNVWENALPSWFTSDPTATETLINPVTAFTAAPSSILTPAVRTRGLRLVPEPFAAISSECASDSQEGAWASVSDSKAKAPGEKISGGGLNHVLAYCDGSNWIVITAPSGNR